MSYEWVGGVAVAAVSAGLAWLWKRSRAKESTRAQADAIEATHAPKIRQLRLVAENLSKQVEVDQAEVSRARAAAATAEAEYNALQSKILTPAELAERTRNLSL